MALAHPLLLPFSTTVAPLVEERFTRNNGSGAVVPQWRRLAGILSVSAIGGLQGSPATSSAACCSPDGSEFAVLALLSYANGETSTQEDGVILLFDAESPKPIASWLVKKASGGSISFVKGDISLDANADSSRDKEAILLVLCKWFS